jgi:hypothetical protein
MKFRLGCDPEVFTIDDKTGKFLSIIGKIKANKWKPRPIEGMPDGFTLQEDNVALEFGIPPASSADEYVAHIQSVMKAGLQAVPNTLFSRLSCAVFAPDQMQHPLAHIFGCEPDFNAWSGKENKKPVPPHPNMRSAGGHVHIETTLPKENVIRACDLFLGVPSVLMDEGTERRKLYGSAGCYRPKPYGVEYRTLSNFWIFDENHIRWVWDNVEKALEFSDEDYMNTIPGLNTNIVKCINTGNKQLAADLVKEYDLEVV